MCALTHPIERFRQSFTLCRTRWTCWIRRLLHRPLIIWNRPRKVAHSICCLRGCCSPGEHLLLSWWRESIGGHDKRRCFVLLLGRSAPIQSKSWSVRTRPQRSATLRSRWQMWTPQPADAVAFDAEPSVKKVADGFCSWIGRAVLQKRQILPPSVPLIPSLEPLDIVWNSNLMLLCCLPRGIHSGDMSWTDSAKHFGRNHWSGGERFYFHWKYRGNIGSSVVGRHSAASKYFPFFDFPRCGRYVGPDSCITCCRAYFFVLCFL